MRPRDGNTSRVIGAGKIGTLGGPGSAKVELSKLAFEVILGALGSFPDFIISISYREQNLKSDRVRLERSKS